MAESKAPTRTRAQIEKDIAAARARLSQNVSDLITEAHPKVVVQRQVQQAKTFAAAQVADLKSQVKTDDGWRTGRLAAVGGAVAGFVAFLLVVRALVKKAKQARG